MAGPWGGRALESWGDLVLGLGVTDHRALWSLRLEFAGPGVQGLRGLKTKGSWDVWVKGLGVTGLGDQRPWFHRFLGSRGLGVMGPWYHRALGLLGLGAMWSLSHGAFGR